MADDEMRKMNIGVLQDDGVIFLWVTGNALPLDSFFVQSHLVKVCQCPGEKRHFTSLSFKKHLLQCNGTEFIGYNIMFPNFLKDDKFCTGRAMELGRECLDIWGYKRVDELIWVKVNQLQRLIRTGRTGHWLNHSKEHCLVGIKGNPNLNRNVDCDVVVGEVGLFIGRPCLFDNHLIHISFRVTRYDSICCNKIRAADQRSKMSSVI